MKKILNELILTTPKLNKLERNKYYELKFFSNDEKLKIINLKTESEKYENLFKSYEENDKLYNIISTNQSYEFRNIKLLKDNNEQNITEYKKKLNEDLERILNEKKIKEEKEKNLIKQINEKKLLTEKEELEKKLSVKYEKIFNLRKVNLNNFNSCKKIFINESKQLEVEKNNELERIITNDKKGEKINDINKSSNNDNIKEKNEINKYPFEKKLNEIKDKSYLILNDKYNSYDINKILEYILLIDEFIQEEINLDKDNGFNNLMLPNIAINSNNYINKFLGYFGSELSLYYINNVYIERNPTNVFIRDLIFKIILKYITKQRVYKLIIESPQIQKNISEKMKQWNMFNNIVRVRLSKYFEISEKDIYFYNYNAKKYEVNMLIYNKKFRTVENVLNDLEIKVKRCNLLNNLILSSNMFETKFCKNINDWSNKDGKRGGEIYFHPRGWIGLALKIKDKYERDDIWIGNKGKEGEWAIAYHGIGKGNEFEKILNILNNGLQKGPNQFYSHHLNINTLNKKIYCGHGVYLTPDIQYAEKYAENTKLGENNENFKFIVMTRVQPKRIRDPGVYPTNWVLNASSDEIRIYRLLVKIS